MNLMNQSKRINKSIDKQNTDKNIGDNNNNNNDSDDAKDYYHYTNDSFNT